MKTFIHDEHEFYLSSWSDRTSQKWINKWIGYKGKQIKQQLWKGSHRALNWPLERAIFWEGNGGYIFRTDNDRASLLLLSSSVRTNGSCLTFTSSPAHWNPPIPQPRRVKVTASFIYRIQWMLFFGSGVAGKIREKCIFFFSRGSPTVDHLFCPTACDAVWAESAPSQQTVGQLFAGIPLFLQETGMKKQWESETKGGGGNFKDGEQQLGLAAGLGDVGPVETSPAWIIRLSPHLHSRIGADGTSRPSTTRQVTQTCRRTGNRMSRTQHFCGFKGNNSRIQTNLPTFLTFFFSFFCTCATCFFCCCCCGSTACCSTFWITIISDVIMW